MSCPVTGSSLSSISSSSSSRRYLVLAAVGVAAIAGLAYSLYSKNGGGGEQFDGVCTRPMKLKKRRKLRMKRILNGSASSGNSTDGSVLSAKGDPSPSDIDLAKKEKKEDEPAK